MEIEYLTWSDERIANEFPGFVKIPLFKDHLINEKGDVYSLKHDKAVLINKQKRGNQWFYIIRKNGKCHSSTKEDLIICAFGRFDEVPIVSTDSFILKVKREKLMQKKAIQ